MPEQGKVRKDFRTPDLTLAWSKPTVFSQDRISAEFHATFLPHLARALPGASHPHREFTALQRREGLSPKKGLRYTVAL